MHKEIKKCRICGNEDLAQVLDLGAHYIDGVFPQNPGQKIDLLPLELVKCRESSFRDNCGLLQLKHSYAFERTYWEGYGYRSGLNSSMVSSLQRIAEKAVLHAELKPDDVIIDIGSNDGTLLKAYPQGKCELIGIDPGGNKFKKYYPGHIQFIGEYFSAGVVRKIIGSKKARVVTSIALLYSVESPVEMMRQIYDILADDGIWIFEQMYMPFMLERNMYDSICHEHLSYFGLKQLQWMADKVGFKIVDVELNKVNGGSILVTAAKSIKGNSAGLARVEKLIEEEKNKSLHTIEPYEGFKKNVQAHRVKFRETLKNINAAGGTVIGYGASTKGNVLLQYCGLTKNDIPCIAEINEDKFGAYTPGTLIPIIPEAQALANHPDYLLVFPWHFKDNIIEKEKKFLAEGGKLIFPLPDVVIC